MTEGHGSPVVDVHAHVTPAGLLEMLERPGGVHGVDISDGRIRVGDRLGARTDPSLTDRDQRLRFLDAVGIDVQFIAPWIELLAYTLPADDGVAFAGVVNRAIADEAAAAPDRLTAIGTVPLQAGGEVAAEALRSAVTELGMAGVQIGTHLPGSSLSDPGLRPFFAEAERLGALILLHPHYAGELRPMHPALEYAIANPADSTLAVAQLMYSGRLAEHPRLKMVVSHGGGFLPFQLARLESGWSRVGGDGATPAELLSRLHVDSILNDASSLRLAVERMGAARVLLGTDYPFPLGDLDPLPSIDALGLSPEERRDIVGGNARRLLAG